MPSIDLAPSILFYLGYLPVTTTFLLQVVVSLLIAGSLILTAAKWKRVPGKFQLLVETLITLAYSQVDKITNDHLRTKKLFPLIFTLFIFILVSNLITLFPGLSAVSYRDISFAPFWQITV